MANVAMGSEILENPIMISEVVSYNREWNVKYV